MGFGGDRERAFLLAQTGEEGVAVRSHPSGGEIQEKKIASVFHGIQGDGTGGILPIHIIALLPPQRAMKQHISVLTKTKDQVALSSLLAAAFQRKKNYENHMLLFY